MEILRKKVAGRKRAGRRMPAWKRITAPSGSPCSAGLQPAVSQIFNLQGVLRPDAFELSVGETPTVTRETRVLVRL
jgi:hypothetical protein